MECDAGTLSGAARQTVRGIAHVTELGFRLGLVGAAAFVGLGIIAAATIGTRRVKRSELPHRAPQPQPQT